MKQIVSDPKIFGGKPVIRGTRISVEYLLELLASGLSVEAILKEFPHLTRRDMRAALDYAAKVLKRDEIIWPLASGR